MKTTRRLLAALVLYPASVLMAEIPLQEAERDQSIPLAQPGKTQQLTSPDQVPEGLAKSDWSSIRAAYEAGRHAFQPIEGGWQARNPGQQWTTRFDGRGFLTQPRDGGWQWGLELKSYGFGERQTPIGGTPAVKAAGQRLSYQWDTTVQEWWVNDQRGLEHGFTVTKRPSEKTVRHGDTETQRQAADSPSPSFPVSSSPRLSFTLTTRGTLKPKVTEDAQGVLYQDAAGATVLNYTGLKVWDADGKTLTSRFEAAGENGVRLLVDERTARYPITIDPIAQQAYLKPANVGSSQEDDQFGYSVAVSGDTVVVGALLENSSTTGINSTPNETGIDAGAVYVYVRNGTTWSEQAYLKASQVTAGDRFGATVAIDGDTVVVGAYSEDSSTTGINSTPDEGASGAGAAYVFVRSGTTWSQQAYLKASQVNASDQFGYSVAVSGDTVAVGAWLEDSSTTGINSTPDEGASGAGATYVFVRSGTTWSQQAYLKASQVDIFDEFGRSVALSGDTVVVGAIGEDSTTTGINSTPNESATGVGAAYVFVRNGTTWSQQAYLKAHQVNENDNFGVSVAVAGDTVVVGAYGEASSTTGINSTPNELADSAGAAYVFVRSGTTWSQQAYLKASQVNASDLFGVAVAVSGDTVVVGANLEDSNTTGSNSTPNELALSAGAAYVYVRSGTSWSQQAYLKPTTTGSQAGDLFGTSVAVSGDTVVVGASGEDSSSTGINSTPDELFNGIDSGAAYVFVRSGTVWSQQAYLKPAAVGTTQQGDGFGGSVAIAGDTVVVGAIGEDSSTTGVNSVPDELAIFAGAAYVFVRNGTTWSQQAYLKASEVDGNDQFGIAVAVAGDTIVVGANLEDSSTTGINSTPDDFGINVNTGAAYVFVRSGTTWSQQAYLKASQVNTGDQFGISVAVSGDTVAVGAPFEDSSTTGINSTPNESRPNAGAAYVFVRSGTSWSQQAYLKASQVSVGDSFGNSVAVSGDTVVVGAPQEDSSTTGINSTPNEGSTDAGAAYVFVRSGTDWSQQAYLKASQVTANDLFGTSVAASGDTIVVGAWLEDSSSTGINSTPDESASGAGAAYVFVRNNGTLWSQQAYLKASQVTGDDNFGRSVAVSGDTVVVGASGEDSGTRGVNSTPNEGASASGAAFIFTGLGPLPSADIEVAQGAPLVDGGDSIDFGTVVVTTSGEPLTFTITNTGTADLTSLVVTKNGTNAAEFVVSALSGTSVPVGGGSVTFTVTFAPIGGNEIKTAALHIASNTPGPKNPFDIPLYGTGQTPAQALEAALSDAGLFGANAEPDATPFKDGVANLLKYALNMNLGGADSSTMPPGGTSGLPGITAQPNGASSIFRYEFVRRRKSGLIYTPQKNGDLASPNTWAPLTDTPTVTPIDANWERVLYEESYDSATTPRCFGRVQVALPP